MDKATIPAVEAEVTFLSAEDGGRSTPLQLDHPTAFYRPHFVVGDPQQRRPIVDANGVCTEEYLGVQFRRANIRLGPGQKATLQVDLMFYPGCRYERLQPGVTFTVREGGRIVGYGRIVQRRDDGAI